MVYYMLCNNCYDKGKKVEMTCIGETKPQTTEEERQLIHDLPGVKINGKKKWECPECGYKRTGNGKSMADLKEELK